jgi:hypothetical protein
MPDGIACPSRCRVPQQANASLVLPRMATHVANITTVNIIHLDDAEWRIKMRASLQMAVPDKEHVR